MKDRVTEIVEAFENGSLTESEALATLHELTGKTVAADWLRNYWSSESIEDFVDRLCAKPIIDWEQITDDAALALIDEYLKTDSPGRRDSIETAIARRYGKAEGTLCDLVYQRGLADPRTILEELKKDTRIYL